MSEVMPSSSRGQCRRAPCPVPVQPPCRCRCRATSVCVTGSFIADHDCGELGQETIAGGIDDGLRYLVRQHARRRVRQVGAPIRIDAVESDGLKQRACLGELRLILSVAALNPVAPPVNSRAVNKGVCDDKERTRLKRNEQLVRRVVRIATEIGRPVANGD